MLRATLIGSGDRFERTRQMMSDFPSAEFEALESAADEAELDPGWDGDFIILAYPTGEQEELIVRELAADRHVLAVEHLAMDAEEAQRCVTIALNRGLRLAVLKLTEPVEPQIERFAAWIEGGVEPEYSGRRWRSERFGSGASP